MWLANKRIKWSQYKTYAKKDKARGLTGGGALDARREALHPPRLSLPRATAPLTLWRVFPQVGIFVSVVSKHPFTFETCCWCCRPSGSGGRNVKGGRVKDAAQDGSVKVCIFPIVIFRWRRTGSRGPSSSTPGCVHVRPPVRDDDDDTLDPLPHHHHRRRRRRQHVKDAAQDVSKNVAEDVVQDVAFGARAARALLAMPPPPPSLCSSR